ncbi:NADH dehydrogenase subunit N [Humibacillus xanthopallidus]|uniref:NADH dehydrogenase subunit N n=1 Tax=Humibacillus xanthopallidus TaxID=412689 RepID=A0A543PN32_9MICO|nr:proton-conducting transporter membrane subunit [Humibacillus xanthopallidus]TQN45484.1 NADH dehydrogenase subunit N [Humibacillus xanthopallidus]
MSVSVDVAVLWPALVPIAGLVLVLVADLVVPRLRRVPYAIAGVASIATVVATIPGLGLGGGSARSTFCISAAAGASGASGAAGAVAADLPQTCLWQADALTSTLQLAAALAAAVCIALAWPGASRRRPADATSEPVEAVLLLAALTGTVVVAASRDVGTWLVALELATLPVIALVALSGRRSAVAGATQLLVTSLVSFALLVLGVALWFAATGSPFLTPDAALSSGRAQGVGWFSYAPLGPGETATTMSGAAGATVVAWPSVSAGVLSLGVVLLLAGVGFKLSLVPFHAWTPTAYSGASTPIAAFLATVSKVAALAALLVVLRAVAALGTPALITIGVLAALSMTLGNLMALRQDDVVRLLAWSTVAQAGWVVMPLVSVSALGIGASATYLLAYVIGTLVAFAVVAVTLRERPDGRDLTAYDGLWHRKPWRAGALVLALTSLAGLPPGIIGLVGKVVALRPVIAEGWVWLAVVAAVNAVIGVAVYLRWLRGVITAPEPTSADEALPVTATTAATLATEQRRVALAGLVVAAAVLVVVSVQPDLLLRLLG